MLNLRTVDREGLAKKIIGLAIGIHKEIGPGFPEKIYQRALGISLKQGNVAFEKEKKFRILLRNELLGYQLIDFLVENELVVEIKAIEEIKNLHISQVVSYLKATSKRLGLILNFGQAKLQIKRVIL